MSSLTPGRVDPRALLASVKARDVGRGSARPFLRHAAVAAVAMAGLTSFGAMVVRANDDSSALAFIQQQTRAMRIAREPAAQPRAFPASYHLPTAFLIPQRAAARSERETMRRAQPSPIVGAYAPFAGFAPFDSQALGRSGLGAPPASARRAPRAATGAAAQKAVRSDGIGGQVYCVRTCDGFYFPLGASTGSERGDAAACARLCPTAETRVYVSQGGADFDDARARDTGRRYVQLANAYAYRTSRTENCACNASGVGLTIPATIANDRTLRPGDIVVTAKGLRVFTGGTAPYREANFTTLDRARFVERGAREQLKRIEQASSTQRARRAASDPQRHEREAERLRIAAERLQPDMGRPRYVGPERSAVAR